MEQLINDRLQDNLSLFKLSWAAVALNTIISQSEAIHDSYPFFLGYLHEEEVAAEGKRRIRTAMQTAKAVHGLINPLDSSSIPNVAEISFNILVVLNCGYLQKFNGMYQHFTQ
ncbi:hypothetical protein DSCW_51960 [Desulfosarcina widdelii]|uniref:Uncharacterized protein n=1 Tax=Desulfosarcina widdelii TaxID=947919 RepID=A0A5K7ZC91_9BACT|nr:hypothetical protein DSCW_51960 [Desulfosarcina widdelii]